MTQWSIEPFDTKKHDRTGFDCGKSMLTDWLHKRVNQDADRDLSRTHVIVVSGQVRVLGYFCLASHHILPGTMPIEQAKGLPTGWPIPAVLLGRLATDLSVQGRGLGKLLLMYALREVALVSEKMGIRVVVVDAIDGIAEGFYRKYGFISTRDNQGRLFLPMKIIRKLTR